MPNPRPNARAPHPVSNTLPAVSPDNPWKTLGAEVRYENNWIKVTEHDVINPAGKPGIARAEHLTQVGLPMLFLQGTRDALADLALVTGVVHGCFHLPLILIATTYDEHGSRWLVAPIVVGTLTMGGVFYAYLWDRTHTVWPVAMAHGAVNTAFATGAGALVITSDADFAYVAGESGIATFAAVAVVGAVFLARAKVWRTDMSAVNVPKPELKPVA